MTKHQYKYSFIYIFCFFHRIEFQTLIPALLLQLYHSQKDDPPLARNMPPIAGKILWVRQLYRRISEPINYFFVSQC